MFDLQIAVCDRFRLSPFQIRQEPLSEFCLLVQRLNDQSDRNPNQTTKDGNIRRPAKDNWF